MLAILCAVMAVEAGEKVKVACFGNSITEGSGVRDRITDSYPGVLQSLLGTDYVVRNYGISAHTLMMRSDRPLMRTDLFRRALEWNPDIVTIKLGTNDSKRQNERFIDTDFVHDLTFMIDLLQQLPSKPKVYLCTPVPATAVQYNIHDSIIVNKEIPLIRKVAADKGLEIIDLYTVLKPYGDLFPDHIHPNEAGAVKIAEAIYPAIAGKQPAGYSRPQYPGVKGVVDGYTTYSFPYWGREVTVTVPAKVKNENNPWVLRTAVGPLGLRDRKMLDRGYFVVSYDVAGELGNAEGTADLKRLAERVAKAFPLDAGKFTLEASGLGAAAAVAGAAAMPAKIQALLLDAPVVDLKAWADLSSDNREQVLQAYGLWQWDNRRMPYDLDDIASKLGKAGISVAVVNADDGGALQNKLQKAGCKTASVD